MINESPTLNNLGSANWLVNINGQEEIAIKLVKFQLPSVNAGVTAIGNRSEFILQTSGDHIQYDNLEIEFLVDENLLNYIKLYKWMRRNAKEGIADDTSISVHFIGNDKKFQGIEVEFYECFPIALGEIDLETDGNEPDVHCSATFAYTAFDFVTKTDRDADLPNDQLVSKR